MVRDPSLTLPQVAQRGHTEGKKAQEYPSSCLGATFIMLSPGGKTVLWAELAHIVLKAGQGLNACPADPREFLAPFLHGYDGFFRSTRR